MRMRKWFLPLVIILTLLVSTGCSTNKLTHLFRKNPQTSNLPASALFLDGAAIRQETVHLLESAQKSIYIEQNLFDDPALMNLVLAKQREGLTVKILLDRWQPANQATLAALKSQNVSIQFYPALKGQYDDVKLLVVDQKKALIYGPAWTPSVWQNTHDLAVELSGYSAWWTALVFARDWNFTTTLSLGVPQKTSFPNDNITLATNANLQQQISEQILQANHSIWIESPEVSDPSTVQSLVNAAAKGRDVRLILDPREKKTAPDALAKLRSGGVKVRFVKDSAVPAFHLNVGIFDQKTFIFTSSDWTYYTFVINHEFSITVPSAAATAKLDAVFDHDWAQAQ
ncbi:Phospholipase D-like domain protein [Acididesulfobacillus acetoxydans]|uniref:phospholipase D n=1 Tax=Acididesulfobacillus acetoxydans TaxID=1561005 RepID=A0A8S0WNE4_9FIRM|nr:phosphatidylserine/phosphatidylglycerophosphate/cardiolipin synthase family protein [Acididesulfobacillus acetoxydans]CAA7601274.1 Phospholipase D-like domain protein [Acididesulfobacillus acetoxydans]CEJ08816.1 Phosphatidylserine/phosphatidylglycerophosphate/ cardiolipin synthase [Acididesulfobacillus acetoxydans]